MADTHVHQLVEQFEDVWRSGRQPSLEEFLSAATTAERRYLLLELAATDLEWRLRAGQPARVEDYAGRFPELTDADLLDLIATEYAVRRLSEPGLDTTEYLARFPAHRAELPTCLERRAAAVGGPLPPGFEPLGVLGRGGSGVVYKARQQEPDRVVAVKVLHGSPDGPGRRRFGEEVNAAARLVHDRIVRVLQVGEHQGRPFCVMEHLEGGSLADRLGKRPLSPSEAAGLVAELAGAVQFAHDHQVIHRDLKPHNVLLGQDGSPRVTDFGLARRLDIDTRLTTSDALLGTPSYMAPEQARRSGDVGPPADIYALGAILYECLTGRPPFQTDDLVETLKQVVGQEPASPRRLNPRVPRDLETVCLKCLEKDPARRYPQARDLEGDLKAFQEGRPIRARPAGAAERGWRWCRRNPMTALLLGAVAACLVVGTAVAWGLALEARKQASESRRQAGEARRHLRFAARSVKDLLDQINQERFRGVPGLKPVQRAALEKAGEVYERLAGEEAGDPAVRLELAAANNRLGVVSHQLGELSRAEQAHDRAEKELAALCEEADTPAADLERVKNFHNLGRLAHTRERLGEAAGHYERARRLLEGLIAKEPGVADHQRELAALLGDEARLASAREDYVAARDGYLRAIAALEGLGAAATADDRQRLALAWNNVASPHLELKEADKADKALQTGLKLRTGLAEAFPSVTDYQQDLVQSHHNVGIRALGSAQPGRSEHHFRKALEICDRIDYPLSPDLRSQRLRTTVGLGAACQQTKRVGEAEAAFREAARGYEQLTHLYPLTPGYGELLGQVYDQLAALAQGREDASGVRRNRLLALALWERMAKAHPGVPRYQSDLALTHVYLGELDRDQKGWKEAEGHWRLAESIWARLVRDHPNDPQIGLFRMNLDMVRKDLAGLPQGKKD